MDIQLPKLNGLEVAKRLRQSSDFNHVPIIAVSAYAMKGDLERFINAGCGAYTSKPLSVHELPLMIAEMLQQRRKDSPQVKRMEDGVDDGKENSYHR